MRRCETYLTKRSRSLRTIGTYVDVSSISPKSLPVTAQVKHMVQHMVQHMVLSGLTSAWRACLTVTEEIKLTVWSLTQDLATLSCYAS